MPGPNGTSNASFYPALLEWSKDSKTIEQLFYEDNPVMGLLPKREVGGKFVDIPMQFAANPGKGANYYKAFNQQQSGQYGTFHVPLNAYYAFATVDEKTRRASEGDGSFEEVTRTELEGTMISYSNQIAEQMWGTGDGILATGTISNGVISLTNQADAIKFQDGQVIQALNSSGVPFANLGYVISFSGSAGTLTVSPNAGIGQAAGTPTGWTGTLSFTNNGDAAAVMTGIPGFIVGAATTAGGVLQTRPAPGQTTAVNSLFGVDRSPNPDFLAGVYLPLTNYSVEQALIQGTIQARRITGAKVDILTLNPTSLAELEKELTGRREYTELTGPTGFKTTAITVNTGDQQVPIIADRFQPPASVYGLKLDTWRVYSMGPIGSVATYQDGIMWFRNHGQADSSTMTYSGYPAIGCRNPGKNWCGSLQV